MKRSKNAREMKAIAKAVSQSEKSMEKISMNQSKTMRVHSAKTLYESLLLFPAFLTKASTDVISIEIPSNFLCNHECIDFFYHLLK